MSPPAQNFWTILIIMHCCNQTWQWKSRQFDAVSIETKASTHARHRTIAWDARGNGDCSGAQRRSALGDQLLSDNATANPTHSLERQLVVGLSDIFFKKIPSINRWSVGWLIFLKRVETTNQTASASWVIINSWDLTPSISDRVDSTWQALTNTHDKHAGTPGWGPASVFVGDDCSSPPTKAESTTVSDDRTKQFELRRIVVWRIKETSYK